MKFNSSIHAGTVADINITVSISHLTLDQLHLLWHQHLGHFTPIMSLICIIMLMATLLFLLPLLWIIALICAKAKLHKAACGQASSHWATCCFQGLSIDFDFMVQQSLNIDCVKQLTGLNGEHAITLTVDHFNGMFFLFQGPTY